MKVTKAQLKKIIKEELEATIQEQSGDEMAQAKELAQVLAKSPAVMAAVQQAAKDPEVQAAHAEATKQMNENESWQYKNSDKGRAARRRQVDASSAAAMAGLSGYMATVAATIGATAPVMALGLTGGVALAAMGLLVAKKIDPDFFKWD